MKTPRYYQAEALQAIDDYFASGENTNPIVVMATGCGKSLVIAEYIRLALEHDPSVRAICAVDTKELVQQNYETFMEQVPFAPAGIYSSGLRRKQKNAQILFCGIQSVWDKAFELEKADILFIDECHGVSYEGMRWSTFLDDMQKINPNMIIIGVTATPYRMDSGLLWTGEPRLFNGVAYEYSVKQGIADGYLSNIISKAMVTKLDVTGVGKTKGDYIESQLQKAVNKDEITKAAVQEIIQYGKDRKAWLVFGAGVKHCNAIAKELREQGIETEIVLGDTPNKTRDDIIKRFKNGEIKCLVNNAVLTKGFDAPFIDLIAAMRPTQSAVLWMQMVGRGFRIADGKKDCLLLDFARNVEHFGFIDEIQFKDKKKSESDDESIPPMKECDNCQTFCHAAVKICPECDHEFIFEEEAKHSDKSYEGAVLSTQNVSVEYEVTDYDWQIHDRKNPPSLRVTYYCGINRFSEWICFEHTGFARTKAVNWWKSRIDESKIKTSEEAQRFIKMGYVPNTIKEAIEWKHLMKVPAAIRVKKEGKYDRITGYSEEELNKADQSHLEQNQHEANENDAIVW